MKKTVLLSDDVKDSNGNVFATMRVVLEGDGSTPNVMTHDVIAGYDDNGKPISQDVDEAALKNSQQAFMAEAIKVQKSLTEEKGGDPSKVNIIGAEKDMKLKPTAQQTMTAAMMKSIASLQMQVAQLKKENKDNGN
jgi:D-tyrosyl-tRNA(Tyr) deacylase